MVSRRKILSRSRDDVHSMFETMEEEEDVWLDKEKLFKDHIAEVLSKWNSIDDEIWAKVIVFERNRRVAKAYARAPVLTVNGSDEGFDGFRIGLYGFQNPMRDPQTEEILKHIGQGVKLKMDDTGNVLIKKVSRCSVFVKIGHENNEWGGAIGDDLLRSPNSCLEVEKPMKLFDMKKFQTNLNRELRSSYPDQRKLEFQCLTPIVFVKSEMDLLHCPIWLLIINVVAIDMLRARLPPAHRLGSIDIKNRPRIPIPDEDPYSVAGNESGSSQGSGLDPTVYAVTGREDRYNQRGQDKPPKLPPRKIMSPHNLSKTEHMNKGFPLLPLSTSRSKRRSSTKQIDDPYYCGLKARVPNFAARSRPKEANSIYGKLPAPSRQPHDSSDHLHSSARQKMWYTKSLESGINIDVHQSPYDHIFGKVHVPTRAYIPNPRHGTYIGEWDS